jgi:cell division protein FtsB
VRRPSAQSGGPAGRTPARATKRPRLTGRAAILVLVLAVLTVSYASSLRAYLQQRQHIEDLNAQIARTGDDIQRLEREKRRWDDDAYVATQARQRLNYVFPGEESYIVLDENGDPLDSTEQLSDPGSTGKADPTAWWSTAWGSVEAAGHPPSEVTRQGPAGTIKAPAE